jgi:hypothetical protein
MSVNKYNMVRAGQQGINCPKCGYKLYKQRCFNCDYAERGSDGPWAADATDQSLIWDAQSIWDIADRFFSENDIKYKAVFGYLKQRRIHDLAVTCDQLRMTWGLNRTLRIRSYAGYLVARIWHVHRGFVGVHVTGIEWTGYDYARDDRRTVGVCQGGAVWFGKVTPDAPCIIGE